MRPLFAAAQSAEVNELMEHLYTFMEVQGFAFGVHENYVSMFRGQYDPELSVNEILNDDRTPEGWRELCQEAGFDDLELSPIYMAVYLDHMDHMKGEHHHEQFGVPPVVGEENYGVFFEETGVFRATRGKRRYRPIVGGTSIGSIATPNSAGTLGGFVKDVANGEAFLVTCSHVLSRKGYSVVQQGICDGGSDPGDVIGVTDFVVPLQSATGYTLADPYNDSDVAAASLADGIMLNPSMRLHGPVTSVVRTLKLEQGDEVIFVGKESDRQEAYVHALLARVRLDIDGTIYNFGEVFEIRPRRTIYIGSLSRPGDSGSWVVRPSGSGGELCGMLFGASDKGSALCSFAETFLSDLGLEANATFELA